MGEAGTASGSFDKILAPCFLKIEHGRIQRKKAAEIIRETQTKGGETTVAEKRQLSYT